MKKPCCVDSITRSPDSSSCSMVLRSACSHGHSHKSFITTDVQKQESIQRKRKSLKGSSERLSKSVKISNSENSSNTNSCKESSKLVSSFESSLEQLSLKSTKTFSILKEHLYNQLHFSENQKCEFTDLDQEAFGCIKKLDFSQTSSPITSLYLDTQYESRKLSDDMQSIERDYNYNTTNMSRTRRLNRNSLRTLSGSETEDDVSFSSNRVKLKRNKASDALAHLNSSGEKISSQSQSDIYVSSNHNNISRRVSASSTSGSMITAADCLYNTSTGFSESYQRSPVSSSQVNISTVQCSSTLDRLRWLLWSYIYLKIIKIVNFDVWLLSRLGRRRQIVLILLLPLLLYLLYNLLGNGSELASRSHDVLTSSISTLSSYVYSLLSPTSKKSEEMEAAKSSIFFQIGSVFSAFWRIIQSFFSNIFIPVKTTSFTSQTTSHSSDPKIKSDSSLTKQEVELLAVKTLDARFKELALKMQASQDVKAEAMNAVLQKEIADLGIQFKSLFSSIQQLEKNIHRTDKQHGVFFDSLNSKMKDFEERLSYLGSLKKCCDEKLTTADFAASVEKHLVLAFKNVMAGERNADSPYHFFHQWLNSKFVDPNKLSAELNVAFEKMKKQQSSDVKLDQNSLNLVETIVQRYVETLKTQLASASSTKTTYDNSLTLHDMKRIVKEALLLYDADKTGKVDYALESGGGSILSTRCSESYIEKNGRFHVLGVPLWSDENSPRTAIQPDVQPGKCWAFKGSQGYLVIQLSYTIYPTGFTLEHIPVSLSPSGSIDSAPKEFSVWGLTSEKDFEGILLGQYAFEIDGEPLQYFEVQNFTTVPFSLVELKIHSNHGNLEYTCLYRFRVHGTRA